MGRKGHGVTTVWGQGANLPIMFSLNSCSLGDSRHERKYCNKSVLISKSRLVAKGHSVLLWYGVCTQLLCFGWRGCYVSVLLCFASKCSLLFILLTKRKKLKIILSVLFLNGLYAHFGCE